jgi:hypothetical protein
MKINGTEAVREKAKSMMEAADSAERFAMEQSDLLIKTHTKYDHVTLNAEKRRLESLHRTAKALRTRYNSFIKKNGL